MFCLDSLGEENEVTDYDLNKIKEIEKSIRYENNTF